MGDVRRELRSMRPGELRKVGGARVVRPGAAELYDLTGAGEDWLLSLDEAERWIVQPWPLRLPEAHVERRPSRTPERPARRPTPRGMAAVRGASAALMKKKTCASSGA